MTADPSPEQFTNGLPAAASDDPYNPVSSDNDWEKSAFIPSAERAITANTP